MPSRRCMSDQERRQRRLAALILERAFHLPAAHAQQRAHHARRTDEYERFLRLAAAMLVGARFRVELSVSLGFESASRRRLEVLFHAARSVCLRPLSSC